MANRNLRYLGLGLAVLTAGGIAACSSDSPAPGGSAGNTSVAGAHSGGAANGGANTAGANTAGANTAGANTGGANTAGAGGGSAGYACTNTALTSDVITDFSNLVPKGTDFTFVGGVKGGTFTYQAGALTLDTVGNTALNVKGSVNDYYGFGLYFDTCYNAGAYTGVSFSIKGYAGPKGKVSFRVQTNSNTKISMMNMKGTCVSSLPDPAYADCHASAFDVPVTATPTVVTVMFSQLKDGIPVPVVDGKDVVGLEWAFDKPPAGTAGAGGAAAGGAGGASGGAGGASGGSGGKAGSGAGGSSAGSGGSGGAAAGPYNADVTIDDVKFIGGPVFSSGGAGAGGASSGGASTGGSGGASAGAGGAKAGSGGTGG